MRTLPVILLLVVVPFAPAADEKTVIATGDWSETVDGVSAQTGRTGYLLVANEAWELEAGKKYTVNARVVSKAKDPKGWAGPLTLPAVEFRP